MNWKNEFFSEMKRMEKTAIVGSLLMGGLTAMDVSSQTKEMKQKVQLNPLKRNNQSFQLPSPSTFQFEGGKRAPLSGAQKPSSLYD